MKWKPKLNEAFYTISSSLLQGFITTLHINNGGGLAKHVIRKNTCFKTEKQAKAVLTKIKALLKEGK